MSIQVFALLIQYLIGGLIERGIRTGEFRAVPVEATVHLLIAPMLHMLLHEHSFGEQDICNKTMSAEELLEAQMSLLLHGLLAQPGSSPVQAPGL